MNHGLRTRLWWALAVLLLLLAFGLRVWDLDHAPPGLTHDEASNGHDSAAILRGTHRLYFPVGYGHEPLYNYSVAVATRLFGQRIFTLRITTVFWGMAQVVLAAALARRWWGRPAALLVLVTYAVSFWALMLSRVGLRAPVLPALLVASALAYDHALTAPSSRAWGAYGLAGVLLGAAFYTYMASRGMPLLYLLYLPALAFTHRGLFRRAWRGTLGVVLIALLIGAPLFLYLHAHPELEQRIGQLGAAVTALRAGDWRPLWRNVSDSLPMLLWRGDPYWLYNIAERPGLEPLLAVIFVVGLVGALVNLRDRRHLFLLIWLAGGLAPALIAPVAYNLLHAIGAMPAVFLLAAHGAEILVQAARRVLAGRPAVRRGLAALAVGAFALTGAQTAHAYFVTWAGQRDVRVAYHHHVVALGRHFQTQAEPGLTVITSLYPGEFHDAYVMEVVAGHADNAMRWSDGRSALFVPTAPAQLAVEAQTQPTDPLWAHIAPDVTALTTLAFRDDDIPSRTRIYRWDAPATWARLAPALATEVQVQGGDPPPAAPHVRTEAPIGFGVVTLEGYRLEPAADGTVNLLTAWRVEGIPEADLAIFAHLLDADGGLVDQDDRLDAPSWQWQPGDRFLHVHTLTLPDRAVPAPYVIALGLYERESLSRLDAVPASETLAGTATRILLPIEVTP